MRVRIAILKPCCIGDVIFATALLAAIRRQFPDAAIGWLVSSSAVQAIADHPDLNQVIVIGDSANPAKGIRGVLRVAGQLRAGKYDLLFVPDRSPWLSLAALLSGIPRRVGLDSGGRGFSYTERVKVIPTEVRREAEIYLDLARALDILTEDCWANVTPNPEAQAFVHDLLLTHGADWLTRPLVIVHPGGGVNPGMVLTSKRWPTNCLAFLTIRIVDYMKGQTRDGKRGAVVILGAASDLEAVRALRAELPDDVEVLDLSEQLTLPQIAALAAMPNVRIYVGNDTGTAHMAAAAGARTLMIFGPSDPRRYAPFVPPERAAVAWRPTAVAVTGVAGGDVAGFDWKRDGVTVADAWIHAQQLLDQAHGR